MFLNVFLMYHLSLDIYLFFLISQNVSPPQFLSISLSFLKSSKNNTTFKIKGVSLAKEPFQNVNSFRYKNLQTNQSRLIDFFLLVSESSGSSVEPLNFWLIKLSFICNNNQMLVNQKKSEFDYKNPKNSNFK